MARKRSFHGWLYDRNARVWIGPQSGSGQKFQVEARYWSIPWTNDARAHLKGKWVRHRQRNLDQVGIYPAVNNAWVWLGEAWDTYRKEKQ